MDRNLKDVLYLDTLDNKFGRMAETKQVVKAGILFSAIQENEAAELTSYNAGSRYRRAR